MKGVLSRKYQKVQAKGQKRQFLNNSFTKEKITNKIAILILFLKFKYLQNLIFDFSHNEVKEKGNTVG
jgi:hypothetical protein